MGEPSARAEKGTSNGTLFNANKQEPEKSIQSEWLDVHSMFRTIQGEGPFAGEPALFIRLGGCNLQCPGCDTDYTVGRKLMLPALIVDWCRRWTFPNRLVVITGGEPFRQALKPLIDYLVDFDFRVQIETNGTLFQPLDYAFVTVVCAPKTPHIDSRLEQYIAAYKYVVEYERIAVADGLPITILGKPCEVHRPKRKDVPVFVQPFDSGNPEANKKHIEAAVWSAQTYGYRLCLQMHKILGME